MGSLGSQKTQPTLQGGVEAKSSDFISCHLFDTSDIIFYFILMMSMPVSVRLTWSPAAAQSRASSCRVIPAEEPQDGSVTQLA